MVNRPCVKCGLPGTISHSQTATVFYCSSCYGEGIRLNFRSVLSRTKIFRNGRNPDQKPIEVLIVVEWDARAKVLSQLIHEVTTETNPKKHFKINPTVYIVDSNDSLKVKTPTDCPLKVDGVVHLSAGLDSIVETKNTNPMRPKIETYRRLLGASKSQSIISELKRLMFDLLLWKLAVNLNIDVVLTSESSNLIAQRTLDLMCFGRSQSVSILCSTLDQRHERIQIVRPLRNIADSEIEFLLFEPENQTPPKFSQTGDPTTQKFLSHAMKSGFPSTVSTVLSVVSKLDNWKSNQTANANDDLSLCSICLMQSSDDRELCELCDNLLQQVSSSDERSFVHSALRYR
ncbi:Thiouridylase, cytoplasmic, subunit 2 family-containing protein [Aphelenchoides besseyi]|nr:Thiouridylase, cytoplasmic, subunit 2 family-containing protein [Aphelenchoides besseyi]